jgi:hypothetical protein
VKEYRLFRLRANNSIIDAVEIIVQSDEDAIKEAIRIDHAQVIEIWQRGRMVVRVNPDTGPSNPE